MAAIDNIGNNNGSTQFEIYKWINKRCPKVVKDTVNDAIKQGVEDGKLKNGSNKNRFVVEMAKPVTNVSITIIDSAQNSLSRRNSRVQKSGYA